jgi:beta-barrel assembly-enhancing protease
MMRPLLVQSAAFVLMSSMASTPVLAAPTKEDIAAYHELAALDLRFAKVGYRIAAANAEFCAQTARNPGWVIHDIAQYPKADIASAAFQFPTNIAVADIVPGGPADNAGLKAGDGLQPYYQSAVTGKNLGNARIEEYRLRLSDQLNSNGFAMLTIMRGGKEMTVKLAPPPVCASDFVIDTANGINAGANGKTVRITADLARYARGDTDLAAIVAHEISHNILQHRAKQDAMNVKRGIGAQFGKSKAAILANEIEADRLSVWLLYNAGYDSEAAMQFWDRYAGKYGAGIFSGGTHLRWKNRIKTMRAEMDLIANAHKINGRAVPPLLIKK